MSVNAALVRHSGRSGGTRHAPPDNPKPCTLLCRGDGVLKLFDRLFGRQFAVEVLRDDVVHCILHRRRRAVAVRHGTEQRTARIGFREIRHALLAAIVESVARSSTNCRSRTSFIGCIPAPTGPGAQGQTTCRHYQLAMCLYQLAMYLSAVPVWCPCQDERLRGRVESRSGSTRNDLTFGNLGGWAGFPRNGRLGAKSSRDIMTGRPCYMQVRSAAQTAGRDANRMPCINRGHLETHLNCGRFRHVSRTWSLFRSHRKGLKLIDIIFDSGTEIHGFI